MMLYWSVGKRVREDVLGGERAEYGQAVVRRLAERLTERYGRGWSRRNLERMIHFAEWLPSAEKCATLSRILSWSHFTEFLAIVELQEREFYVTFAAHEGWSVRTLRNRLRYRPGLGGGARSAVRYRRGSCWAGAHRCESEGA